MADSYGHHLIYCAERNNYYVWTGQQWRFNDFVEAEKRAEKTILEAFSETKHITDGETRKAFLRFVNNSLSRAALANMMHLAKKKVRQASANAFDQDPWMLNTENGTVDLRTGALRPHRPKDLLSKMIPLRYDQHAECPRFIIGQRPADKNTQHLIMCVGAAGAEMAMYESLAHVAAAAGDGVTEQLARVLQAEEKDDYEKAWALLGPSARDAFSKVVASSTSG